MELFLMVFAVSMIGVAMSVVAFSAATHDVRADAPERNTAEPASMRTMMESRFFLEKPAATDLRPQVPVEVLLRRLESHVRLEQAAAESFILAPTLASLHTPTASPLVH